MPRASIVAPIAFAIPLAIAAPALGSITGWFMSDNSLSGPNGPSGGQVEYAIDVTQQPTFRGIKISGSAGPIIGESFQGNPLVLELSGFNTETVFAGEVIETDLTVFFNVDGGNINVLKAETDYFFSPARGFNAVHGEINFGAGTPVNNELQLNYLTDALTEDMGFAQWRFRLTFEWLNATANSFLAINIPGDSIDLRVAVPAPASATLLLLAAGASRRRRR